MTQARRQPPQALGVTESLLCDYAAAARYHALDNVVVCPHALPTMVYGVLAEPSVKAQRILTLQLASLALCISLCLTFALSKLMSQLC